MNQSIRIAYRNVGRQKKRTVLLAGAVGVGFFIITVTGGFTGGLSESARHNFSSTFGGHLYFSGSQVSERGSEIAVMADPSALESVILKQGDRIASTQRRSNSQGTLISGTKERRQSLAGVDYSRETGFGDALTIVSGSLESLSDPSSLLLPADAADSLGVQVGETVLWKNSTVSGQQNVTELVLVATFAGQSGIGASSGYANLDTVNSILGLGAGEYQDINVWLRDVSTIDETADMMYADLLALAPVAERETDDGSIPMRGMMTKTMGGGGAKKVADGKGWSGTRYSMSTLNELMSDFNVIISTIDAIGFWVFVILMLITMVGVMNSYRMIMVERTGEIGTMRALGVQRSGIRDIFLWEAVFIALVGALAGYIAGLAVMGIAGLPSFGGASMLSFFLDKGHLSFRVSLLEGARNLAILCVFSLVAVSFPARAAARLEPAEALRTSY